MSKNNIKKHCSVLFFKWYTDILIWIIGLTIMIVLAVKEFCPLLHEYRNNNVATWLKVAGQNDTVGPPLLTLCISRSSVQLQEIAKHLQDTLSNRSSSCDQCEKMADKSWDAWSEMKLVDLSPDPEWAVSQALIGKLLATNENDRFNIVSVDHFLWNQPLIDAVWNYYVRILMMDVNFSIPEESKNLLVPYMDASLDSFLLNKSGVDLLFERIVSVICEHMSGFLSKNACLRVLIDAPSAMHSVSFCYQLPINEKGANISVTPSTEFGLWRALSAASKFSIRVYLDVERMTWFLSVGTPLHQSEEFNHSEETEIRYLVVVTVVEKRKIDCYEEDTAAKCIGFCLGKKITELCQCIPFTYRYYASSEIKHHNYCNTISYANCEINKTTAMDVCRGQCSVPCKHISYQYHITTHISSHQKNRSFRLYVQPISSPFIAFTITNKNTREQFASQVGAVLNLYLGISGVSLIAIIVQCARFVKKWRLKKKINVATGNVEEFRLGSNNNLDRLQNSVRPETTAENEVSDFVETTKQEIEKLRLEMQETNRTTLHMFQELRNDIRDIKKNHV